MRFWPVAPRFAASAAPVDGNPKPVTADQCALPLDPKRPPPMPALPPRRGSLASCAPTAQLESSQEEAAWPVAPPSAAHFLVTLVKRPGETSFGFRFRQTREGHRLQCVLARSPAARWNDENCADECLLPRDIIVRADSDFRLASTRKVRLLIWLRVPFEEAVLAFKTAFMDDEHVQ